MLTLPIKRIWYDMIAAGEKKEEYRPLTPYYDSRFTNAPRFMDDGKYQFYVVLRNGYRRDSRAMVIACWIDIGEGKPEWGADIGKEYFRLHITWKCLIDAEKSALTEEEIIRAIQGGRREG